MVSLDTPSNSSQATTISASSLSSSDVINNSASNSNLNPCTSQNETISKIQRISPSMEHSVPETCVKNDDESTSSSSCIQSTSKNLSTVSILISNNNNYKIQYKSQFMVQIVTSFLFFLEKVVA